MLEQLGVAFTVAVSGVKELTAGPPDEVVLENAYRKAAAVAGSRSGSDAGAGELVLGVDTEVVIGTRIFGKPADQEQAREILGALSGRQHVVLSGVCVIEAGRHRSAVARTTVQCRTVDQRLMDWYLASGEWRGRAGGYAIQGRGAALVAGVEGDYSNVVGLPVPTLLELVPGLLQNFAQLSLGRD
ncbi:MAG: Maf family protein [Solirubrobacteraceae bacterium]